MSEELLPSSVRFLDSRGDNLSKGRRQIVERFLEHYPTLIKERIATTSIQTITHGDAHFWNFLVSEQSTKPVVLIDWQLWNVDFGAWDLAYMIALHWFPDRRKRFEKHLLELYRTELDQNGVIYAADDLALDYRLQVLRTIVVPIMFHERNVDAGIWWAPMDRSFSAIDDLDCLELLP